MQPSGELFQTDITITKLSATGCLKVLSFYGLCIVRKRIKLEAVPYFQLILAAIN
jgi:hypothetical protein